MARKEKRYHFIYKTTNLLSGKYYIGMHSTNNLEDGYLGSGKRLRYSINKHGKDNHKLEILEFVNSRKDLSIRENEIINLNEIAKVECMNLVVGGEGGFISLSACTKGGFELQKKIKSNDKFIIEQKEWSKVGGINKSKMYGWDVLLKNSYDWTNKTHSEESKKKMSESSKGIGKGSNNSQYGTCWITKNDNNKKIKKENLEIYLNDGWIKGRKLK